VRFRAAQVVVNLHVIFLRGCLSMVLHPVSGSLSIFSFSGKCVCSKDLSVGGSVCHFEHGQASA
jgi:hypothetical protein